jgi:hypothetical protein
MAFHRHKCNVLTIWRNKTPVKFNYCLHDHVLESVDKEEYLEGTLSEDLKWESHINNICGKASKTLDFLRRNLNIGSTSVKEQSYTSLVRPSLEYACSVWDPHLKTDKQNRNGSTEGCEICHQTDNEIHLVLVTCYNILNDAASKINAEMHALSWCIKSSMTRWRSVKVKTFTAPETVLKHALSVISGPIM